MRKQFFFVILILCSLFIQAQKTLKEDKVYIDSISPTNLFDDTPVGMGVLIGNNQNFDKKHRPEITITPPTIISADKNEKGELSIQAYVNSDYINIIAQGINRGNVNDYRAFRRINEQGHEVEYKLVVSERNPTFIADDDDLNFNDKLFPYGKTFYYTIKNKSDSIISTLKLKLVFPQPEPWILSIDERLLSLYENSPSALVFFRPEDIESFRKQLSLADFANAKINPATNLPQKLVLPSSKNSFLLIFKGLTGGETYLEYKLDNDSVMRKNTAKSPNPAILLKDLSDGKHKLQVAFPLGKVWEYEFEIKPHWTETTAFKVVLGIVITALISWVFFRIYNKRQKAKLKQAVAQRKQVQNQIQSLRSQLDPHFIFNSLSSIQSLINRNDIEAANLYISKIGALLHEILEKSDTLMHPLAIELQQVEHYLQLEQLRFKFEYHINVPSSINPSEIDIPIMLLQPYIENAIKHGIVEKREEGKIALNIGRQDSTMVITITDNGKGYDTSGKREGHGNRLVAERIVMLNKLLSNQQITIELNSEKGKGTKVTIYFANWL